VKPKTFMLIAGEASGDLLAAELIAALKAQLEGTHSPPTHDVQPFHNTGLAPHFFGAGGPRMKAAGVELSFDLTQHSVIGISWVKKYFELRRLFNQLFRLALERQPDVIIGVDYNLFNLRFARAIKNHIRRHRGQFNNWNPKIVKYISPQVWASREGRVYQMARDYDLLLSIFPFEKDWYAARVPELRVEFVGHPIMDRIQKSEFRSQNINFTPSLLLLPGSRPDELRRHLPVMLESLQKIRAAIPNLRAKMVLPDESLVQQAKSFNLPANLEIQVGNLPQALSQASVAIASTGTVTMECAYFGLPTVAIYKTSFITYEIGKRIVTVEHLAMPNILAGEEIFPEFIQSDATVKNISRVALEFLNSEERRNKVEIKLADVVAKLGEPGASGRAAKAIVELLDASP